MLPEIKAFRAPVKLDLPGEAEGSVRALFSVFARRDDAGDVVERSFFHDGQAIPMSAWGHAWGELPPGRGTIHVAEAGAEFHGRFFLDTHSGREHYTTVRNLAELQEWSFGFKVTDSREGEFEGQPARFLRKGDTYEASPVLVGANRNTRTLALKAAGISDERLDALLQLIDGGDLEFRAEWDAAWINTLPDSAFAIVLPGGEKDDTGRTVPRRLRRLPHHNSAGSVDLPHLRNALSRLPQTDLTAAQQATARRHLEAHARRENVGDHGLADAETHAGRAISAARVETLRSVVARLRDMGALADELDQLLAEAAPAEEPKAAGLYAEALRYYARLAGEGSTT